MIVKVITSPSRMVIWRFTAQSHVGLWTAPIRDCRPRQKGPQVQNTPLILTSRIRVIFALGAMKLETIHALATQAGIKFNEHTSLCDLRSKITEFAVAHGGLKILENDSGASIADAPPSALVIDADDMPEVLPGATIQEVMHINVWDYLGPKADPAEVQECKWIEEEACFSNPQAWDYVVKLGLEPRAAIPSKLKPAFRLAHSANVAYIIFHQA